MLAAVVGAELCAVVTVVAALVVACCVLVFDGACSDVCESLVNPGFFGSATSLPSLHPAAASVSAVASKALHRLDHIMLDLIRRVKLSRVLPQGHLLYDDLVGTRVSIAPGQQVILGRAGNIPLGADDSAMHRHFLQLWNQQGAWYIRNIGSFITARLIARGSNRFVPQRLSPQTTLPIPPGEVGVTFDTKNMAYEIALTNAAPPPRYEHTPVPDAPFTAEGFEPNAEQLLLLRALAEPLWRDPSAEAHVVVPSVDQLAEQLGWTAKQTNQRMQRIVDALERAGVPEFQRGTTQVPWRVQLAKYASEQYRPQGS